MGIIRMVGKTCRARGGRCAWPRELQRTYSWCSLDYSDPLIPRGHSFQQVLGEMLRKLPNFFWIRAVVYWQTFNNWFLGREWGVALIYSICQFLWCKYSHHDRFHITDLASVNTELGRGVYKWILCKEFLHWEWVEILAILSINPPFLKAPCKTQFSVLDQCLWWGRKG